MNKDAFNSSSFGGLLTLILGPILARWGIDNETTQAIVVSIVTLVGAGLTWYGRQRANGQITTIGGANLPKILIPAKQPVPEEIKL